MAKIQIDSKISGLITLKSMISNLKLHSNIIAFDPDSSLFYMTPNDETGECFGIIYDPELISASKEFHHYLIKTPDVVAFNKALKKTKTKVSLNQEDKSLRYETEEYQDTLIIPWIEDYSDLTKMYSKLFKDKEITKNSLDAIYNENIEWKVINDHEFDQLKNNELVIVNSITSDPIFISKSIFGGLKKTKSLSHTVIKTESDSEIVMFKLEEEGYYIYKLIRYLTNL